MKYCDGITGFVFGHNFTHVFHHAEFLPKELADRQMEGYGMDRVLAAMRTKKDTYVHSVCTRCGQVIKDENKKG